MPADPTPAPPAGPVLGTAYDQLPPETPVPDGVAAVVWRLFEDEGLAEDGSNDPARSAREVTRLLCSAREEGAAAERERLVSYLREFKSRSDVLRIADAIAAGKVWPS